MPPGQVQRTGHTAGQRRVRDLTGQAGVRLPVRSPWRRDADLRKTVLLDAAQSCPGQRRCSDQAWLICPYPGRYAPQVQRARRTDVRVPGRAGTRHGVAQTGQEGMETVPCPCSVCHHEREDLGRVLGDCHRSERSRWRLMTGHGGDLRTAAGRGSSGATGLGR